MNSISEEMLTEYNLEYKLERIEQGADSYWKPTRLEYGIDEYAFENVEELKKRIEEMTGISTKLAKRLAVETFIRYFENVKKGKNEIQEICIPDFVYRV